MIERITTVEKTVPPEKQLSETDGEDEEPPSAQREQRPGVEIHGPALLKSTAYEHWYVEPPEYGFGVDGATSGRDLEWEGWGTETARALGTIWQRGSYPDNSIHRFPGEIVARGLELCDGHLFYKQVLYNAEGTGGEPIDLETPCTGGAPYQDSAVTGKGEADY